MLNTPVTPLSKPQKGVMILTLLLPLWNLLLMIILSPVLKDSLQLLPEYTQYLVVAYLFAGLIGLLGSLYWQQRIGLKNAWYMAMVIFIVGIAWVLWAPHLIALLQGYIVQGFAMGLLIPMMPRLLHALQDDVQASQTLHEMRQFTLLCWGLVPIMVLVGVHCCGWRSVWWFNLMMVIVILYLGRYLPTMVAQRVRFHFLVFLLLCMALFLLFFGLVSFHLNQMVSGTACVVASLVIGAVGLWLNQRCQKPLLKLIYSRSNLLLWLIVGLISFLLLSVMMLYPLVSFQQYQSPEGVAVALAMQCVGLWLGYRYFKRILQGIQVIRRMAIPILISAVTIALIYNGTALQILGFFLRGLCFGWLWGILHQYIHEQRDTDGAEHRYMAYYLVLQLAGVLASVFVAYQIFQMIVTEQPLWSIYVLLMILTVIGSLVCLIVSYFFPPKGVSSTSMD